MGSRDGTTPRQFPRLPQPALSRQAGDGKVETISKTISRLDLSNKMNIGYIGYFGYFGYTGC